MWRWGWGETVGKGGVGEEAWRGTEAQRSKVAHQTTCSTLWENLTGMYFTKRQVGASTLFTFKFLGQSLLNLKRFNGTSAHAPPHPSHPSLQAIGKQHPSMTHPLISEPLTPSPPHPSLQVIVKQHSDLTVPHPLTPSPVTPRSIPLFLSPWVPYSDHQQLLTAEDATQPTVEGDLWVWDFISTSHS